MCGIDRIITEHLNTLATFIIAAFTGTLWWSTRKLWIAHRDTRQATQRAFVYIDGLNYELTTAADQTPVTVDLLPDAYKSRPALFVTRLSLLQKCGNSLVS
jgi:hypothetical protein